MVSPSLNSARIDFDEELEKRVRDALRRPQVPGLRSVRPIVHAGTVVLRGGVGSFYEKQLARSLSRRVPGVFDVVDELDVVKFADTTRDDGPPGLAVDDRREQWYEFFRA